MVSTVFLFLALAFAASSAQITLREFKFYVHDEYNTSEISNVHVAGPPFFDPRISNGTMGAVSVFDDLVTEGPERTSRSLGRAQGMSINCALALDTTFWSFTVVFNGGEFGGSSLSIQGLDRYFIPGRELSVIGGTGKLRSANGYTNMYTMSVQNGTSVFLFTGIVKHKNSINVY